MTKDKQCEALEALDHINFCYSSELVMDTAVQKDFNAIREALSTDSRAGECNVDNQPINEKLKAIMDAPTPFTPAADEVVVKRVELEHLFSEICDCFWTDTNPIDGGQKLMGMDYVGKKLGNALSILTRALKTHDERE